MDLGGIKYYLNVDVSKKVIYCNNKCFCAHLCFFFILLIKKNIIYKREEVRTIKSKDNL